MNGKGNAAVTMAVRVSAAAATVLLCGLRTASAQDTDEITVEVGECIEIEAPVERLACFAAQVEQALTAESEAAEAGSGAAPEDAAAAEERVVEASPPQPVRTEPASPAQDPVEEPDLPAQQADAVPAAPVATPRRPVGRVAREPEPEAVAAAAAEADTEDLNWFERRRARRAARAAEREAEERAEAAEAAANEIRATITALRERGPNSWLITLDNGQMWDQVRPQWYPLRPGQQVRLYPTNWGSSYRLSEVDRGGYIQVQRVR